MSVSTHHFMDYTSDHQTPIIYSDTLSDHYSITIEHEYPQNLMDQLRQLVDNLKNTIVVLTQHNNQLLKENEQIRKELDRSILIIPDVPE